MDPGTTRPLGGCGCGGGSPIKGCAARPRTCKTQAPGGRTHNPSVRRRAILQATRTTLQQWRGRGRPRVPGRLGARGRAGRTWWITPEKPIMAARPCVTSASSYLARTAALEPRESGSKPRLPGCGARARKAAGALLCEWLQWPAAAAPSDHTCVKDPRGAATRGQRWGCTWRFGLPNMSTGVMAKLPARSVSDPSRGAWAAVLDEYTRLSTRLFPASPAGGGCWSAQAPCTVHRARLWIDSGAHAFCEGRVRGQKPGRGGHRLEIISMRPMATRMEIMPPRGADAHASSASFLEKASPGRWTTYARHPPRSGRVKCAPVQLQIRAGEHEDGTACKGARCGSGVCGNAGGVGPPGRCSRSTRACTRGRA